MSDMDRSIDIVNALTAILLHAEAIKQRSAGDDLIEISQSATHIVLNTKRVWRALEPTLNLAARQVVLDQTAPCTALGSGRRGSDPTGSISSSATRKS